MTAKIDIINRALQRVGSRRLASLTEDSEQASESVALYDSVRRAELRRNLWVKATRRTVMRAIGAFNASKFVTFGSWAAGTTYAVGDIALGSDSVVYQSTAAANLAHDPSSTSGYWTPYIGPDVAQEYVTTWSATITYAVGDHAVGSDSSVYVSLVAGNLNHNPVSDAVRWSVATTANADDTTEATDTSVYTGEMFFIGSKVYLSLQSANEDAPGTSKWLLFVTLPTLALPNFLYPIGSGPSTDTGTANVFRLPYGWLREAPQDPHNPVWPRDWLYESSYIVTSDPGPIVYRFVADIADTTIFDPLFVEGLSARIALELSQRLTQDKALLSVLIAEYKQFMGDARLVGAIEDGPLALEEDDWLTVKVSGASSPFQYS